MGYHLSSKSPQPSLLLSTLAAAGFFTRPADVGEIATCVDGAGTPGDVGAGVSHELLSSQPLLATGGFGAGGGGFGTDVGGAMPMPSEPKRSSSGAALGFGARAGDGAGATAG